MLAIHQDGGTVGSVSGGCVEETLVQRHQKGALVPLNYSGHLN
jgi:xanthine/CO dehydrogenase XdhC/CoxF family maturation factor